MVGMLGGIYAKLGKMDEVKKLLAELETPPVNNDKLYAKAVIKSALGQTDETFNILEKLLNEKYGILIYMKVDQQFFEDADNPRFKRMLQKLGFE
jgi:hypothetical protein